MSQQNLFWESKKFNLEVKVLNDVKLCGYAIVSHARERDNP